MRGRETRTGRSSPCPAPATSISDSPSRCGARKSNELRNCELRAPLTETLPPLTRSRPPLIVIGRTPSGPVPSACAPNILSATSRSSFGRRPSDSGKSVSKRTSPSIRQATPRRSRRTAPALPRVQHAGILGPAADAINNDAIALLLELATHRAAATDQRPRIVADGGPLDHATAFGQKSRQDHPSRIIFRGGNVDISAQRSGRTDSDVVGRNFGPGIV